MELQELQEQSAAVDSPVVATVAEKKIRFSGVELLRILAILLICINHAVQTSEQFIDFDNTLTVGTVFLKVLRYSGQIGNILFVICSSYFLLDSKRTKGEKALNLLLDSMFISIFILIGFLIGGHKLSTSQILVQFFPDLWFIPTYVLFYILHPLYNSAIEKMDKKAHFTFVAVLAILGTIHIFVKISLGLINNVMGFAAIYFVVAYMKKYMSDFCESVKKNVIVFCVFSAVFIICAILKYVLGMRVAYISSMTLDGYFSPLLLPALLSLFNLFNKMKFKNRAVNYFASCSLFVYCFHEHPLLRSITRVEFYKYVFGINPGLYVVWVLVCAFGMFFGAYLLSVIYRETVHRLTAWVSKKLCALIEKVINFFYKKSM